MPNNTFNPVHAALGLGGTYGTSGINWSYTIFASLTACEQFAKLCEDNGYRTRNTYKLGETGWAIQYHHYAD